MINGINFYLQTKYQGSYLFGPIQKWRK